MSTESAKQFIKRMQEDKAFAGSVEKLGSKEERAVFVKLAGFDFSREELTAAASELNAVDVVGGRCCGYTCESEPCDPLHICSIAG